MTNEEAVKILKGAIKKPNTKDGYLGQAIDLAIKALEQQPCEDCISLNKLDDIITKAIDDSENQTECQTLRWVLDVMSELPSVIPQPKATGSWVEKQVVDNEEVEIEQWQSARCSNCDKYHTTPYSYYFDDYNYCPNCGAKMESEEKK